MLEARVGSVDHVVVVCIALYELADGFVPEDGCGVLSQLVGIYLLLFPGCGGRSVDCDGCQVELVIVWQVSAEVDEGVEITEVGLLGLEISELASDFVFLVDPGGLGSGPLCELLPSDELRVVRAVDFVFGHGERAFGIGLQCHEMDDGYDDDGNVAVADADSGAVGLKL